MLPTIVTPCFKRRKPIYKELFEELKNQIGCLVTKIPSDNQPQDSLEEFVVFLFTEERFYPFTSEQKCEYQYNILMFIRLIKEIVENEVITNTLQGVCKKNHIDYTVLRGNHGEIFNKIESERALAHNKAYLNKKPLEYPLFEESDLVFEYSEWRKFAPLQEVFEHKMSEIKKDLWKSGNFIEKITHDVLKEMYYIYYAIYESYFALSIIKDGKEKHPALYFNENEGILKYLQEIEIGLTNQTKVPNVEELVIIQGENSDLFFATPKGFEHEYKITKLAKLLTNNKYLQPENSSTFVSLFFYNEETKKNNKKITWNKSKYSLKLLFSELYIDRKVPRGTWKKIAKYFSDSNGYPFSYDTIVGITKSKCKQNLTEDEITKIKSLVESAKMYKEA